jgi:hypothetical protein
LRIDGLLDATWHQAKKSADDGGFEDGRRRREDRTARGHALARLPDAAAILAHILPVSDSGKALAEDTDAQGGKGKQREIPSAAPFSRAIFQTIAGFTIEAVSRKSKPRSFQEFEIAMNIALDSSTLTD